MPLWTQIANGCNSYKSIFCHCCWSQKNLPYIYIGSNETVDFRWFDQEVAMGVAYGGRGRVVGTYRSSYPCQDDMLSHVLQWRRNRGAICTATPN